MQGGLRELVRQQRGRRLSQACTGVVVTPLDPAAAIVSRIVGHSGNNRIQINSNAAVLISSDGAICIS